VIDNAYIGNYNKYKGNLQIILNNIVSEVKAMSILGDYVQAESDKKGSPPGKWLVDIAKNGEPKFTHRHHFLLFACKDTHFFASLYLRIHFFCIFAPN
jgi:hypothetical protein